MVYIFAPTEAERAKLRIALAKFAQGYFESLTTVTVDPLDFPDLPAKLGLEPGVYPAGAVHQLSKDRVYPYPRGLSYDSALFRSGGSTSTRGKSSPGLRRASRLRIATWARPWWRRERSPLTTGREPTYG